MVQCLHIYPMYNLARHIIPKCFNAQYNVNVMRIVTILFCLENDYNKNYQYSAEILFSFLDVLNSWLVDSMKMESVDTAGRCDSFMV